MIKINLKVILMCCLLGPIWCFPAERVTAGGMSSNGGGGIVTYQLNPWFIGNRPVIYCIQRSELFSTPIEQAKFEVEYALDDWLEIIRSIRSGTGYFQLSTNFRFSRHCGEEVDLKILLGVMNQDVRSELEAAGNGFVAFSKRRFDRRTGRTPGYIWIAPDLGQESYKGVNRPVWSTAPLVHKIMLHELGHVFGLKHDTSMIMRTVYPESIADRVVSGRRFDDVENIYLIPEEFKLRLTKETQLQNFGSTPIRACNASPDGLGLPLVLDLLKMNTWQPTYVLCFESSRGTVRDYNDWHLAVYDAHPFLKGNMIKKLRIRSGSKRGNTVGNTAISGRYPNSQDQWVWRYFATFYSQKNEHSIELPGGPLRYRASYKKGSIHLTFAHNGHVAKLYFNLGGEDFWEPISR